MPWIIPGPSVLWVFIADVSRLTICTSRRASYSIFFKLIEVFFFFILYYLVEHIGWCLFEYVSMC